MKRLILIVLSSISLIVNGQEHSIGLEGGINSSNIINLDDYYYWDLVNKNGSTIGINYEHKWNNHFFIKAGIQYNEIGFRYKYENILNVSFPPGTEIPWINHTYHYIGLPISCGLSLGLKFQGFFSLGLSPSMRLKVTTDYLSVAGGVFSGILQDDSRDYNPEFDVGVPISLGCGYSLSANLQVHTSVRYQISLLSFREMDDSEEMNLRHHFFSFVFGIKYSFKKN
ncbi:MAG: PorT family protein [Bacteroidales bacterium]|nr:PorT family protein [Bacteroidales bacterium]